MRRDAAAEELRALLAKEAADLRVLVGRIGMLIERRDANMRRSRKFCLLCPSARFLRTKCPHDLIWEIATAEVNQPAVARYYALSAARIWGDSSKSEPTGGTEGADSGAAPPVSPG
jgi:hypothetical protein